MRAILPRSLVVLCAAFGAGFTPPAAADDWPVLTPGRWQFDRTMEGMTPTPQTVHRTECVDPTGRFRSQQQQLAKAGCTVSPIVRRGNEYRYSASCRMAGTTTVSESVLTVDSPGSYTLRVDSKVDGKTTREVLVARRLGECTK